MTYKHEVHNYYVGMSGAGIHVNVNLHVGFVMGNAKQCFYSPNESGLLQFGGSGKWDNGTMGKLSIFIILRSDTLTWITSFYHLFALFLQAIRVEFKGRTGLPQKHIFLMQCLIC